MPTQNCYKSSDLECWYVQIKVHLYSAVDRAARSYNLYAAQMSEKARADAPAKTKNTLPSSLSPRLSACCIGRNAAPYNSQFPGIAP
jgi:hypothetical protein